MNVSQPASRTLDVRFEQVHRVAVLAPLFSTRFFNRFDERISSSLGKRATEMLEEPLEKRLIPDKKPTLHQPCSDDGIRKRKLASFFRCANTKPEIKSNVRQILHQPGGKVWNQVRHFLGVQQHQVQVGIWRVVSAAVPAVCNQRDPVAQQLAFWLLFDGRHINRHDDTIEKIGQKETQLDAR